MKLESLHTTTEDSRTPEQKVADFADILTILRESGFLKQISIDTDEVAKALSEWQKTGGTSQLVKFFIGTKDENLVKEFGHNGLEAMRMILEEIEEIKKIARGLMSGLKNKREIIEKLKELREIERLQEIERLKKAA